MDLKSKSCLVIDNGLFVHIAIKLAEKFGTVWYWTPSVSAFPKSNSVLIGDGLEQENITRIIEYDDYEDKADLICFPDVGYGGLQERFIRDGRRVWGSRRGENLELDRWGTKKQLIEWNMPVAESHLITGMDALRRFLQNREGKWWVKTSRYRGDFETFSSKNYEHVSTRLDQIEYELGLKSRIYPFIVERDIPAIVEVGYDGFSCNGQFPNIGLYGRESKDEGLVGTAKPYDELPEPVLWVNQKIEEYLRHHQYRGWISSEIRCAEECVTREEPKQFEDCPCLWNEGETTPEGKLFAYYTDPCQRMASPPGELYCEWFDNWPEIVWEGAEGNVVDPEVNSKFGVEIMLHSSFADRNWQPVMFPEEVSKWVKLRNMTRTDGVICAVPQEVGLPEIGAVIGLGDTLLEAGKNAMQVAGKVDGFYVESKCDSFSKAITELHNSEEEGIPFCDEELPTAEEIENLLAEVD